MKTKVHQKKLHSISFGTKLRKYCKQQKQSNSYVTKFSAPSLGDVELKYQRVIPTHLEMSQQIRF